MKFLKSRYLLFLALALLAMELVFRFGLYEPLVSPASHSGTMITVKRAVDEFGKEQVNVITFGDSRASQGMDNDRIYRAGQAFGLNHLKLSIAGSHLMTYKALASWSLEELDNLHGIVIAVTPGSFAALGNGAYELAKVMPLRNEIRAREMFKHVPFRQSDIRTFAPLFSVAGYRDDIKNLLVNPAKRFREVKRRNSRSPLNILTFTGKDEANICAVPIADPDECLRVLREDDLVISDRTRTGLKELCKGAPRGRKIGAPGKANPEVVREWVSFLEVLASKVRVMLVILPENSVYREYKYHRNTMPTHDAIVEQLKGNGIAEVVDLHWLLMHQESSECGFYLDALHLNLPGKQRVTDALLPELEKFWMKMDNTGLGEH